jgi:hypothetical protein
MTDQARRKALREHYEQTPAEAGVYRIVNRVTGKALLGATPNLPSMRNKLDFAHSTGSTGVFDYRLRADVLQYGVAAFELEVLETLDVKPEMTPAQIRADLAALEDLWREQLDPATLY